MARVVLCCWGSYGDLFPYLGLARELKARGHQPVVATCPFYRDLVGGQGLEFRPLRPEIHPDDTATLTRAIHPKRGSEVVVREILMSSVRDSYADTVEAIRDADLVVSHPITYGAPTAAEHLGKRWISTVLSPISFFSVDDLPVVPQMPSAVHIRKLGRWAGRVFVALGKRQTWPWMAPLRELRKELGLSPGGHPLFEGQFSPHGTLALFSPEFAKPQADWPANAHATGFVFDNQSIPMPDELSRFLDGGEPPIVFTLGSSASGVPGTFYEESARAAAAIGRRAVLLTGYHPDNQPRAALTAGAIAVPLAPHDQLFPRAAAIVHCVGIGTAGQALRAGKPQLCVPHAHDQPDNAHRLSKLGVARVLYPKRYSAERAAAELQALLENDAYTRAAEAIGRRVREERGAAAACDLIQGQELDVET